MEDNTIYWIRICSFIRLLGGLYPGQKLEAWWSTSCPSDQNVRKWSPLTAVLQASVIMKKYKQDLNPIFYVTGDLFPSQEIQERPNPEVTVNSAFSIHFTLKRLASLTPLSLTQKLCIYTLMNQPCHLQLYIQSPPQIRLQMPAHFSWVLNPKF